MFAQWALNSTLITNSSSPSQEIPLLEQVYFSWISVLKVDIRRPCGYKNVECGKPMSPFRPLLLRFRAHGLWNTVWLGTSREFWGWSLYLYHCHQGLFPGLCSLFSSLPRVQLTATCFNASATAGRSVQAARPSIKAGPLRTTECQIPLPTHLYQPCLRALPREGPCPLLHWPSEQVPALLADGARVACDTLHTMKKETSLLFMSGKTHSNFLSWPPCHFKVISNCYANG